MNKILTIAVHEYLTNLRRPGFIITTAIFPVLGIIGLVIAAFAGGQALDFLEETFSSEQQRIGVVDRSGVFTPILPEYEDAFTLYADESAGRAALTGNRVDALLVIDQDYLATGNAKLFSIGSGFSGAMIEDSKRLRTFAVDHLLHDTLDEPLRIRAATPLTMELVALNESGDPDASSEMDMAVSFIIPYAASIFLVISIFTSSGYLQQSVAEEKETRVIEIILSSVNAMELMAGKILGLGVLGLTQILIWILSTIALSGGATLLLMLAVPLIARADVLLLAVLYYLLGFALYAILMATAGSLGTTMRESQQLAGLFSFAAAIPYMLASFIFTNPDALMPRLLSYFPLTAPTMMMLRLPLSREIPWGDVVISIALLLISIPAALWVGAKIFRASLLAYGKRPSLRQILSMLRQA